MYFHTKMQKTQDIVFFFLTQHKIYDIILLANPKKDTKEETDESYQTRRLYRGI